VPIGRLFAGGCCLAATLLAGCFGPQAVQCTRARYNEVIQTTSNEELLLNLVRLRYLENPGFLPVTGLTAQFELNAIASGRGGIDRGGTTNYGNGELGFSDRPTVTFAPQRNPEVTKGLLSRIPLDTFYLLAGNGDDVEREVRLFIRNINGVENCTSCGGPAPACAPEFAEFRHVAELLGSLRRQRNVVLAVEQREVEVPGPVLLDPGGAPDVAKLKAAGYGVRWIPEKKQYVLTQTKTLHLLRFHPDALASPEVLELTRLLRLEPGRDSYEVEEIIEGQLRPAVGDGQRTKITITMRSVLEVMYFLSQNVALPPGHICAGLAPVTCNPDGSVFDWGEVLGDLFAVQVGRHKPKTAFIAVRFRDCWFWVDDLDRSSKITLTLFNDLFRLQRIGAAEGQPLLTLPVGR
jgi:hypothetical protein